MKYRNICLHLSHSLLSLPLLRCIEETREKWTERERKKERSGQRERKKERDTEED